jgi:hypothetical protein
MNKDALHYSVRSSLPAGPEKPAAIGAKFLNTLDALTRFDPLFANWEVMDYLRRASVPLATARARIAAIIENNVQRDDWRRPQPDQGYTAGALTDATDGSRMMHLTINVGGQKKGGDTWLHPGDHYDSPPDLSIVTYPMFKAALLAINAIWPPLFAWANAFKSDYWETPLFPGAPLFPSSLFHFTWLGYLSAELADNVKLPPEIKTERTPDGGLLMTATEERIDPTNPEHWRRARILAETMVSRTGESFSTPRGRLIDLSNNPNRPH